MNNEPHTGSPIKAEKHEKGQQNRTKSSGTEYRKQSLESFEIVWNRSQAHFFMKILRVQLIQCTLELPSHFCHPLYHQTKTKQNQFIDSSLFISSYTPINLQLVSLEFYWDCIFQSHWQFYSSQTQWSFPSSQAPYFLATFNYNYTVPFFTRPFLLMKPHSTLIFYLSVHSFLTFTK